MKKLTKKSGKATKASKAAAPKAAAPKAAKSHAKKAKKISGLDAAAQVLHDAKQPLNCKEIVKRLLAQGLWQTKGKTPAATIYAAIIREIAKKGKVSRFRKTDRGKFARAK